MGAGAKVVEGYSGLAEPYSNIPLLSMSQFGSMEGTQVEKGQIRQIGFARKLKEHLDKNQPELSKKLNEAEILLLIEEMFAVLSTLLRSGFRVIFEGFVSFYMKPIERKCSNLHTGQSWMTYKRRLRWTPAPNMKKITEVEITKEQYLEETKKDKTPTGA